MLIFDTHAHYDSEDYLEDREQVLDELQEAGVKHVTNIAYDIDSSRRVLELIDSHPFLYGCIGVHPDEVGGMTEADLTWLAEHASHPKVVAIGEIGLDYYWNKAEKEVQEYWFGRQTKLARTVGLPIVVHSRDAAADTFAQIEKNRAYEVGGIIHAYSYGVPMALEYVKMGFYIGIGGVVTFKNGRKLKEVVQALPLSAIVLETDSPYLTPVPFRGKRNRSDYLRYVAEEIAALKEIPVEEVYAQTYRNALAAYRINKEEA
ncbi:MAG: TatD family hydrolase [Lachnospiraceae bacterium]|nr:TatD family hydrolase [Lachnospiraceae bacterium]MDY5742794.1 TatD family hydrolase [Lachnospiraceae bacterium]